MNTTPQEAWQYGAVLLVIVIVLAFVRFASKAGEAAIRAFTAIATRIEHHEEKDEERHGQLMTKLDSIRVRQESRP